MDEYKRELEYFEAKYENILDGIIKKFGNDFNNYSSNNLKIIDKEELDKVIKEKNFYFADSLGMGYRKDYLIELLLEARDTLDIIEDMRKRIPMERKKDYQRIMTKEEYNRKYENKKKRKKKYKLQRNIVIASLIAAVGIGAVAGSAAQKKDDDYFNSNVCVEYTVQKGDTYKDIENLGLKDIAFSYYETKGAYRDSYIIYAGDVIIGRTTLEVAQRLEEQGLVKIITIEEAIEELGENHSLIGEFKKYAEGKSDIVFYVPTNSKLM